MTDAQALDLARAVLGDIGELASCTYRVGYLGAPPLVGLPALVIEFEAARVGPCTPVLAIVLADRRTGVRFTGDKIQRMLRNGVERYLAEYGTPCVEQMIN